MLKLNGTDIEFVYALFSDDGAMKGIHVGNAAVLLTNFLEKFRRDSHTKDRNSINGSLDDPQIDWIADAFPAC